MSVLKSVITVYNKTSLILRILIGLIIGAVLGLLVPGQEWIGVLGSAFVGALKGIAPVLVFALVISSLANGNSKMDRRFGVVIFLYLITTFLAALVAVCISYVFPQTFTLTTAYQADSVVGGIGEVMENLLLSMVQNPIAAIATGQFIGVLLWAVLIGLAVKKYASQQTKQVIGDISNALTTLVRWIINLAPFGICGLVFSTISETGLDTFTEYGTLVLMLAGCMLFEALFMNPLISFLFLRRNPYPLLFRCLKGSGVTAFFTRSSAANIPVNMELCEKLGLDEDMYSVSIPLGATINMDGAAVTITVLTLATANTLGIHVDFFSAVLMSMLATLGACGASGVAGGSLLLVPMACSMFGIPAEVSMQAVAVGFIIGVIQDSLETALNSSGDVFFTATAEYYSWRKQGKPLPKFLGGTLETEI